MNQKDSINENEPCILVEGPQRPSAEFYGRWLIAAAKADEVWQKAKEAPHFEKQLKRVPNDYFPAFGMAAIKMVSLLSNNSHSAVIRLNNKEEEMQRWCLTMRYMSFFPSTTSTTKCKSQGG